MPDTSPAPPPDDQGALLPPGLTETGTRRRLLERSLVLFAQRGYHGVGVRDLTDAVGIKASSLYAHFASKERVLAELLAVGHGEFLAALRAAHADAGPTPTERLAAMVDAHVRNHATYPLLARVCADDIRGLSEESLAAVLSYRLEIISLFLTTIADGVAADEFADTDPFLTSMAILAMGIRVANWYSGNAAGLEFAPVLGDDASPLNLYDVEQICATYAELALRMVRRP